MPRVFPQAFDSLNSSIGIAIEPQAFTAVASEAADAVMNSPFGQIAASAEISHIQSLQTQQDTSKLEYPGSEQIAISKNRDGEGSKLVDSRKGNKRPLEFTGRHYTSCASVLPGTRACLTGSSRVKDAKRPVSDDKVGNSGEAGIKGSQSLRLAEEQQLIQYDVRSDSHQRLHKRRKLSNAVRPIDICEPIDDDSV
jgi:hypothetical protein